MYVGQKCLINHALSTIDTNIGTAPKPINFIALKTVLSFVRPNVFLIPYTDALLALSDAPLAYFGCAILLEGQKNGLSRQIDCPFLPYTSSLP